MVSSGGSQPAIGQAIPAHEVLGQVDLPLIARMRSICILHFSFSIRD